MNIMRVDSKPSDPHTYVEEDLCVTDESGSRKRIRLKNNVVGDRISQLPDELLVDILSLLSLKEAARTSVLSTRWINLWKHTRSLNFDARSALEDIVKKHWIRRKLMKREGPKYVKWVNTVLQSHKSPTLKEFVIRFTLDATAKNSINLWLQFAFATRQVESCDDDGATPKRFISALPSCISQLQTLRLELYTTTETNEIYKLPEMPKLKKLVVLFFADGGENIFKMTALIRASPSLEEFELKYEWGQLPRKDREIKDPITSFPHHHLKSFKYSGYYGRHCDVALLGYVLENCSALEKIVIDSSGSYGLDKLNMEKTGRKNAKQQLEPRIPQHVELVIL